MKSKITRQGPVTVISLEGNVMGGPDATTLKSQIHELVDEGKNRVVLDLAGVEFMNSSGLAMLINSMTTIRASGGDLKLANVSSKIGALIIVTRLGSVLQSYPSVEEAVAAVRK